MPSYLGFPRSLCVAISLLALAFVGIPAVVNAQGRPLTRWIHQFGTTADDSIESADARRRVTPLAYSREAGVAIFESTDRRFIAHLGRPEGLAAVKGPIPLTAFLDSAKESARAHAEGFFSAWVRRLHEVARARVRVAR